jgi:hypothetical protein
VAAVDFRTQKFETCATRIKKKKKKKKKQQKNHASLLSIHHSAEYSR